jgi:mannose-6-phosphate isomerase-like protein (cupin superfamily)
MTIFSTHKLDELVFHPVSYEQRMISVIDGLGRQIVLSSAGELFQYPDHTIKVEGLEKYSAEIENYIRQLKIDYKHSGPVTCHAFKSFKNSSSFGNHTDPDNVFLLVVDGVKHMRYNNTTYRLEKGQSLFIPANNLHCAINTEESLMLSFGLESYFCEKLK